MGLLRRRAAGGGATRIFFAADLHGSEMTFRKFINAAQFYDVDVLVFGGDLMGKALVPILPEGRDGYRAQFVGKVHKLDGPEAVATFAKSVETMGHYWKICEPAEYELLQDD